MKSTNLRDHEVRRLKEVGSVLVVRPLKPQPRFGQNVYCSLCRKPKAPSGRSLPLGMSASFCNEDEFPECGGYRSEPKPDYLFYGESEADYGYG